MGGFFKGILVGTVSFVLGFAVLSVVIPVEPPRLEPVDPATNIPPNADLIAPTPAAQMTAETSPPEAMPAVADVVEPATADSVAPETIVPQMDAPEANAPDADAPEIAAQETSGVVPAPAVESVVRAVEPTPAMPAAALDAPETDAAEVAAAPVVEPVEADQTPASAPSVPDVQSDSVASVEPGQVEPEPTAPASSEAILTPIEQAAEPLQDAIQEVAETTVSIATQQANDTAPEPVASTVPESATEPAALPIAPAPSVTLQSVPTNTQPTDAATAPTAPSIMPVPATDVPTLPTLDLVPEPVAPTSLPRVEAMPSGAPGVSVRRGAAATPEASSAADVPTAPSAIAARVVEGVTVGRLPRIGATPTAEVEVQPEPVATLPAYRRNAALTDLVPDARPMGIVLIETPDAEAGLLEAPFQATIAMDPYDPDAPRRAAAYRAAGHDIALRVMGVPEGANQQDIETIFQVWMQAFPNVVAMMDIPQDGLGRRRAVAAEVAGVLAREGYGVIALRTGLDAFLQAAREEGLATAAVYRTLDDTGQGLVTIRRLLDRAAFEAERNSQIVVAGSAANPETVAALTDFTEGGGRAGITLVPASAILTLDN